MSDTIIESLGIEIHSNSKDTANGVDALVQSLNKLKPASKHATSGLDVFSKALGNLKNITQSTQGTVAQITSQLGSVNGAVSGISTSSINNVTALSTALSSLKGVKISANIGTQLHAIATAVNGLNVGAGITQLKELGSTIQSLTNMPKLNITSKLNQLKKLPEALEGLEKMDIGKVATQIRDLASALSPLGDEMQKIANGFAAFPDKLQKLISNMDKMSNSNRKAAGSFTDLFHKVQTGISIFKRLGSVIGGFITESNDYVENENLFTVSMSKSADEMKEYAQSVSDVLGIDTGEWMRAQGVFMTISTGFGVASDRAALMSKNLTQLGYDISSFYNISTEDAMDKLKSGLAGELEPLRAIGYDLSQAKLEATALELGIDKTVSSMTQAEKAQLRYYAIMTQVTQVQGDMARTLTSPANQLRVLKAQATMAAREIGNVFIPVLNAVLPIAIAVTKVIGSLASVISGLVGYEPPDLGDSASEMAVNTDAVRENIEGAKEEAKKLKSYMLGFDELNIINPNTDSIVEDTSSEFDFKLPDYSEKFLSNLAESRVNGIVEKMKEWLGITDEIKSWGDLFETKLGDILVVVGSIAIGFTTWKIANALADIELLKTAVSKFKKIGMIALKGVGIAAISAAAGLSAKWLIEHTDDTITKIGAVLSAAFLVVGSILAFTGINLPLGIALMATGALSMGTAIALNTDKLSDEVKGVIAVITGAVSIALLAVGAVLAFSGANIPLGIALIAGGALTLATAVVPNWSAIETTLEGPIGLVTGLVGGAMLALGAILAFSGVGLPLGIALMAVGAASLATAAVVNWDKIVETLQGPVGAITAIAGAAALVLGMILLFSGVGIPLGLGLILGGAAALGTVVAVNWDFIVDKVKEIWGKVKQFWNDHIAQVFTGKWWKNLGITIMNGLIAGIEGGINGIVSGFEWLVNKVVGGLNKISISLPDWDILGDLAGKTFGVNISPVSFGKVSIPRFAEGGFPNTGQLFIAREAGAEMVGNIGRRTAVANNEQIVESISVGVAEANSEQNALLREQNALLRELVAKDSGVYLDGRSLSESVDKYKREKGRVLITGGVV